MLFLVKYIVMHLETSDYNCIGLHQSVWRVLNVSQSLKRETYFPPNQQQLLISCQTAMSAGQTHIFQL